MRRLLPLVAVLLVAGTAATAVDDENSRETLRGLKGAHVKVVRQNAEVEAGGLWTTTIQTDVELKLRQAGIKVLAEDQLRATPGMPLLVIIVSSYRSKNLPRLYAFVVQVELDQVVRLERDPSIRAAHASTWSASGSIGMVGSDKLQSIGEDIKDQVDQFINAYLSVNPK